MKKLALDQSHNREGKGTYVFERLQDKELELSRLTLQATALPALELSYLVKHGLTPDMRVLDAACGPGFTSSIIYDYLDSGEVIGIDIDEVLLKEAEAYSRLNRRPINFQKADIYNLPFESEFDYIYCRLLFQHLEDPEKALASIFKALKPGGIVHILDVNDDWLYLEPPCPAFDKLCELAKTHQAKQGGNRLIGRYLRNYLMQSGFRDVVTEIIPFNSDMIGIDAFIQITTNFKAEQILIDETDEDPQELLNQIRQSILQKDVYGIAGIFSVSGRKA